MPHYRAIFRLKGGRELEAQRGFVPDAFFAAAQHATVDDIIDVYEDGFTLSNEMHDKLDIPGVFTSYAVVGIVAPEGADKKAHFQQNMLHRLKDANHARPLQDNLHYQVFYMEHIESPPDDD